MPVNTVSVGAAVTPTVIQTYISHFFNRKPLVGKPTAHISYHQGLELIRRFLHYASLHTVEELQAFTSQWVPVPHWVHSREVAIPAVQLQRSAEYVVAQLGPAGIQAVGGKAWWQWRQDGDKLKAEWIEMRKDNDARKRLNMEKGDRIMLYVHGGAYFFGSVDEHRYQLQRHARKLKARVIAPKYRLAPQYPFPCGLYDCLAVYLYLLAEEHDPSTILLAGDSAGGGMVLSMLVIIRDQGIPLPAGGILLSPWCDLTHSFPSLGGDGHMDYIPAHGFIYKPSLSWPPPNADDLLEIDQQSYKLKRAPVRAAYHESNVQEEKLKGKDDVWIESERAQRFSAQSSNQEDLPSVSNSAASSHGCDLWVSEDGKYSIGPKGMLSVQLDSDTRAEIKDQIQLYAPNHLLTHPLVSPVLQPTLGGLPPLFIQTGGGELLRDEQIYLAHKAAQPLAYLPPPSNSQTAAMIQDQAANYKPTNVQLQVWDDMCHVGPTLSFTRPAKYMYRSIAQFGAWALGRAQKKAIDILDDDNISVVSSGSSVIPETAQADSASSMNDQKTTPAAAIKPKNFTLKVIGKAGDPIPRFERHMIRQGVDRHGNIYPLPAREELEALKMSSAEVGVPKSGPVGKWMKAQQQWNSKFAKQKLIVQKKRLHERKMGFETLEGETPPPTALAGRRVKGMKVKQSRNKKSWGMAMWSGWGSKHDEVTLDREEKADRSHNLTDVDTTKDDIPGDTISKKSQQTGLTPPSEFDRLKSHSHHSTVVDGGQAAASVGDLTNLAPYNSNVAEPIAPAPEGQTCPSHFLPLTSEICSPGSSSPGIVAKPNSPATIIPPSDTLTTRPTKGGIAYPFSLKLGDSEGKDVNASTLTLESVGIMTPTVEEAPHLEDQVDQDKCVALKSNKKSH